MESTPAVRYPSCEFVDVVVRSPLMESEAAALSIRRRPVETTFVLLRYLG